MGIIPDKHKEHLKQQFENSLVDEVRLAVFTQETECMFCKEARELVQEVAAISNKLKVDVYDFVKDANKAEEYGIDKVPAIIVSGRKPYGIRFYGVPAGYEFKPFTDDIINASKGTTTLLEATKERLKSIDKPVHIQVFVTPTCPHCPSATGLAHQFAIESDFVKSDMVEVTEFPHLAQKYAVMSVPKIVINETVQFVGALPEDHFIQHVLLAVKPSKIYI